jgi:hypothetical protein
MAFIGWLIKRMVPDAASSEDGAGERTKQMSIEAMQLQADGHAAGAPSHAHTKMRKGFMKLMDVARKEPIA